MKKYKILLDGKYIIFITANNAKEAKKKAGIYGCGKIEIIGEQ